jgi:hypothetical protein
MQPDRRERNDKDSPMRRDSTRPVLPSRMVFLAFGLVTLAVAWPQFARAQDAKVAPHETAAPIDPVEDLQQALAIRLEDLTDPKETVLNFRRDTLKRKIARLRRIGDLRRALALEDWKPMDTPQRKEVADLFTERVNRIIAKGDSTARMAVANLIAEIGPQIRAIDPNDKAGFARSLTTQVIELTKDSSPEVQQEALRALGNINPLPRDACGTIGSPPAARPPPHSGSWCASSASCRSAAAPPPASSRSARTSSRSRWPPPPAPATVWPTPTRRCASSVSRQSMRLPAPRPT